MQKEIWKSVKGYEGIYEISNYGRLKSFAQRKEGKIVKPKTTKFGYHRYCLHNNKKRKYFFAHRIVAEHFLSRRIGTTQINHIDGNKINNFVGNLEWVTSKENINHAIENGLYTFNQRFTKLTPEQVQEIRKVILRGNLSDKKIGKQFGMSENCIASIRKGITWKELEWPELEVKQGSI